MRLVGWLAIGAGIQLSAAVAFACQCGSIPDPKRALAGSAAVFEGTAVSVADPMWIGRRAWFAVRSVFADSTERFSQERYLEDYGIRVRFRSDRSWKGKATGEINLLTGRGGGDCGFQFEPGKRYVVFSRRLSNGKLATDICTPTRPTQNPGGVLAALGQPEATR